MSYGHSSGGNGLLLAPFKVQAVSYYSQKEALDLDPSMRNLSTPHNKCGKCRGVCRPAALQSTCTMCVVVGQVVTRQQSALGPGPEEDAPLLCIHGDTPSIRTGSLHIVYPQLNKHTTNITQQQHARLMLTLFRFSVCHC